jgi:hypothetical protein
VIYQGIEPLFLWWTIITDEFTLILISGEIVPHGDKLDVVCPAVTLAFSGTAREELFIRNDVYHLSCALRALQRPDHLFLLDRAFVPLVEGCVIETSEILEICFWDADF